MIWPAWMVASSVLLAFCAWRRMSVAPALYILAGLICTRIAAGVLPYEPRLIACAGLWIGIGGIIVKLHAKPLPGALLIAAGLCYLGARLAASPIVPGSFFFALSDVFGVAAIVSVAWGASNGGIGRGRFLGGTLHRRGAWFGGSVGSVEAQKGAG